MVSPLYVAEGEAVSLSVAWYDPAMSLSSRARLAAALALAGCSSSSVSSAPSDLGPPVAEPSTDPEIGPLAGCTRDPGAPIATVDPAPTSDPTGGPARFTLAQALAGFPDGAAGAGVLTALLRTERGDIRCVLREAEAPVTVANFVGLARGTRPFLRDGASTWAPGRFYDGLTWHRVIPGFVIQGGDPRGDGTGGPGYDLPVEHQVDEPLGALAMAAAAAPSGSQLYIVVGEGPPPEYNVFGRCSTGVATAIANAPRGPDDRPTVPIHIQEVAIARCP